MSKLKKMLAVPSNNYFKLFLFSCFCFLLTNCSEKSATNDLGTFENEKEAYEFTKNTLKFISEECNNGMESATYINEFEKTKLTIFKNPSHEEINRP